MTHAAMRKWKLRDPVELGWERVDEPSKVKPEDIGEAAVKFVEETPQISLPKGRRYQDDIATDGEW